MNIAVLMVNISFSLPTSTLPLPPTQRSLHLQNEVHTCMTSAIIEKWVVRKGSLWLASHITVMVLLGLRSSLF